MIVLAVLVHSIVKIVSCMFNMCMHSLIDRMTFFRTPFTREERYNYVDPDYAYTEEERQKIDIHENAYNELFHEQRFQRSEVKRTK